MAGYKEPGFEDRLKAAAAARAKALAHLKAKPPVDPAMLAERAAKAAKREEQRAGKGASRWRQNARRSVQPGLRRLSKRPLLPNHRRNSLKPRIRQLETRAMRRVKRAGNRSAVPVNENDLIGTAIVPDGVELRLMHSDGDFAIILEHTELMSTDMSASERALATLTCERLGGRRAPQLLIGGYGMGFTLRAALTALGKDASVTVAELVPEFIEWARGPMRNLTAGCLDDARVVLVMDDVAMLIDAAREGYDAILLDVDNGPEGLTRRLNDRLYSRCGLQAAMAALRPQGILAIWSAETDIIFPVQLQEVGFDVTEVRVHALPNGEGACHVIWFALKA